MESITRRYFNTALASALVSAIIRPTQEMEAKNMQEDLAKTPRAIDVGMFVKINGFDQWITIRGRDLRNPVLLWLHGGPGIAMSNQAPVFADWESYFTIVHWDQPGGGATYAKNMESGPGALTFERFTRDGIAVTEFVRTHLHVSKLVLMGISWGTELGLMMLKQRPDLFSAYVGTAQVVSGSRGSKLGYELALKAARERNDSAAIRRFGLLHGGNHYGGACQQSLPSLQPVPGRVRVLTRTCDQDRK